MSDTKTTIDHSLINRAMSYDDYRKLIDERLSEGKSTGDNDSEAMVKYTRLNVQRMNRLDKMAELNASLKKKLKEIKGPWIWLVLTEGWCGDAAQNVPVIHKMAEVTSAIEDKFILRDKHTDIIDQYLTNGGRSIPKMVCLHAETLDELGTWGPRPGDFQQKAMAWKDDPDLEMEAWAEKLHKWYAEDKTETIQADFERLIESWQN